MCRIKNGESIITICFDFSIFYPRILKKRMFNLLNSKLNVKNVAWSDESRFLLRNSDGRVRK